MKKINVCLRMTTHPLYRDFIKYPPNGVIYEIPKSGTTIKDPHIIKKIKKILWIHYTKFRPPAVHIKADADLIHSTFGVLIKNKQPWVVDVEHVAAFSNFYTNVMKNEIYKKQIYNLLFSKYCKKILPWSHACKRSIEAYFESIEINRKMEVVYPAIEPQKTKKTKNTGPTTLIYVSRYFFEKGGMQLLKAFEILDKKYDVRLFVLSNTPNEIKETYKNFKNIKFITKFFFDTNTMNELFKYYMKSDIMVFPSFMDTFGGSLLEAMRCGLPIVTTNIYAIPEIVKDSYNGFIVNSPISLFDKKDYSIKWGQKTNQWKEFHNLTKNVNNEFIDKLVEKISILIESESLRRKMGRNGRKEVEKGKFSIGERNKKLKRIYEEAIKA